MPAITKTSQHARADVFTAIAHPLRRQILDLLSQQQRSVNDLAEAFEVSRPAVSQHLRVLLEVGLISEQRVGRENHYQPQIAPLYEVQSWLSHYQQFWANKLDALGQFLDNQEQKPKL